MVATGKKRIYITLTEERIEQLEDYCRFLERNNKSEVIDEAILCLLRCQGLEDRRGTFEGRLLD